MYWQVLVPEQETRGLWQQYHESLGHLGTEKVLSILRRRFYWPGMLKSVDTWTAACPRCLRQKPGPEVRAPLVPIVTSYPFEVLGIDYLSLGQPGDPFPYILVMTDLFSKYAFAVPTKDQSATTTAKALYSVVIQVIGCPERILSDRGGSFQSAVMEQLCQLYGRPHTTPKVMVHVSSLTKPCCPSLAPFQRQNSTTGHRNSLHYYRLTITPPMAPLA